MSKKYELTFWGGAVGYFPRYRRFHRTRDDAMEEAGRVFEKLEAAGLGSTIGAHQPMIHVAENNHPRR